MALYLGLLVRETALNEHRMLHELVRYATQQVVRHLQTLPLLNLIVQAKMFGYLAEYFLTQLPRPLIIALSDAELAAGAI